MGLKAEGLEEGLGRTVDGTEGLQNKRHQPALVFASKTVVTKMLNASTVVGRLPWVTVEVRVGSWVDDRDIHKGEVVRKVKLEVGAHGTGPDQEAPRSRECQAGWQ